MQHIINIMHLMSHWQIGSVFPQTSVAGCPIFRAPFAKGGRTAIAGRNGAFGISIESCAGRIAFWMGPIAGSLVSVISAN